MWIHVKTAPNKPTAEMWCELLEGEGVPVRVQPDQAEAHLGEIARQWIYVPKDRVEVAEEILRTV